MGKNYGFLSAENKQRVSGEMDSGTKRTQKMRDHIGPDREGYAYLVGTVEVWFIKR